MPIIARDYPLWLSCGFAVIMSAAGIWASETFWSFSVDGKTHTMLPLAAVFISAVVGGFFSGLLSLTITTLAILYFLNPRGVFYIAEEIDRVWLAIYVALALGAVWLGSALKSALSSEKKASDRLEKEVELRTSELTRANRDLRKTVFELEESRKFLDSLIDNIPMPIYVKSAEKLEIVRLNKLARLGASQDIDYIGKTSFDLFSKEAAERLTKADRQALRSRIVMEFEEVIPDPRLGDRVYAIKKVPLYDRLGNAAFILAIAEDVTEKKRIEEQRLRLVYEQAARIEAERKKWELEEAVRARDTFLSICSHELKTPLTSLKLQAGAIRILFEKGDFEALRAQKVRELVMDADKEINRINRLINDMLDVSRIRSGKLSLHLGEVNFSEVVYDVVDHFRSNPAYKDIAIKIDTPAEIRGVWDRNRIEQIVINLVSNALKYGRKNPVVIRVKADKGKVRLIVEDQGVGISPQDQKRIFQRFERAAASESISGLGLGLYIVKEIVTMHGGTIRVESEIGKGSRFTVELPLRSEAMPQVA